MELFGGCDKVTALMWLRLRKNLWCIVMKDFGRLKAKVIWALTTAVGDVYILYSTE